MVTVLDKEKTKQLASTNNPTRMFGTTKKDKKKFKNEYGDLNLDDYEVEAV